MPFNAEEQKNDVLWMGMLCGVENVVDNIEKNEQRRVIRECELPKSMNPSREVFEKLGFGFENIIGDNVM